MSNIQLWTLPDSTYFEPQRVTEGRKPSYETGREEGGRGDESKTGEGRERRRRKRQNEERKEGWMKEGLNGRVNNL